MTAALAQTLPRAMAPSRAAGRDATIDTMRGIAILMVIGIHALQAPLDAPWKLALDAVLRPCVPIFLFASGYLTAASGRVPLGKRLAAALIPYAIAFAAAYVAMAAQNPAMDHRVTTTVARFGLAYVFVYYYVFVYAGCTLMLWLALWFARRDPSAFDARLLAILTLAIGFGLTMGAYLDPLLLRLGLGSALVEEVRMRDIPFWFGFAALGMLVARLDLAPALRRLRLPLAATTLLAYALYAGVRILAIGDAADYDSTAFFFYAATLAMLLLAYDVHHPLLASLGAGSYFVYLWHIFVVMALRDYSALRGLGAAGASLAIDLITTTTTVLALFAVRRWAPPRAARLLGA